MNHCLTKYILCVLIAGIFCHLTVIGQGHKISGTVLDAKNKRPLVNANVSIIRLTDSISFYIATDSEGHFYTAPLIPDRYSISISYLGYTSYRDTIHINGADVHIGRISLSNSSTTLKEVNITEPVPSVKQKGDTLEFNAEAYKVNPDAVAADLLQKMPGIEIDDRNVKAQGEDVNKVLIDGKPFFSNDPYASLEGLPAAIVDKVQVYNEKSEQEQFTGFSEGGTTKTINIITDPDKRNGAFGRFSAGYGTDGKYLAGGNINQFSGDRRITITAQTNNINYQNFSDQNPVTLPGSSGAGIATTNSLGINYSDKWGKKIDVTGSYLFEQTRNNIESELRRTYVLDADSGQIYNETNNTSYQNYSHNFNLRIDYDIDSSNSILLEPHLSIQKNYSNSSVLGNTVQLNTLLNETVNNYFSTQMWYNFSNDLLYRHKFRKKGRTFSFDLNTSNNHNTNPSHLLAQNIFLINTSLNDTLNQQTTLGQNTWSISGNATYTEPVSKNGELQFQYSLNYLPGTSAKDVFFYSNITEGYTLPDSLLSSTFKSENIANKAGGSYMFQHNKLQFSAGLYYQVTTLHNTQYLPNSYQLDRAFYNLLPTATFQYIFSPTNYFHFTYITFTSAPTVTQLQSVINNTNPLQLTTGNPALKQPYEHNFYANYFSTNPASSSTFVVSLSGNYVENYITNNSIIAENDTVLRKDITLPKGSQLISPVNKDGNWNANAYISYGIPVDLIKSNISLNLTGGVAKIPAIINSQINYANTQSAGAGFTISSNINENIDFTVSSNTSLNSDKNSINTSLNNQYIRQNSNAVFNLIFLKRFVFNTELFYQYNSGLSAGFDQSYLLWNVSVGRKLFKNRQGDIRVLVYDFLKQNNNVQHTVTETYIQDMRTNILQRYFMITFTYSLRDLRQ